MGDYSLLLISYPGWSQRSNIAINLSTESGFAK
jgi:hypothetical protein